VLRPAGGCPCKGVAFRYIAIVRMTRHAPLQTRAIDSFVDHPGLTEQLLAIQGLSSTTWTPPSIREAMGVPAVFRAVTFIANLVGSLTLEAWRNGIKMDVPPRLVSRPGVFSTTRDFFRDTAYCLASRGEYIWWAVDRDQDGLTSKLLLLPLEEVHVTRDEKLPLMWKYRWRNKDIPTADIEHGTFAREPGSLRGMGPLQLCGAALSVAVEADEWAARFFSRGGVPSVVLKTATSLAANEAERLLDQWLLREGNEVRVASGGADPVPFQVNPEQAQLLGSRQHAAAQVATMFGMDADLLNAAVSGSSLTYQNVGSRLDNFVRTTLAPNYLEPIEHGISERLSRTTVARFSLSSMLRADVKTQADVYSVLVAAGMDQAQASAIAGIDQLVDTLPLPAPEPLRVEVPA
jgi:HK97 family phage portal protein